MSSSVHRKERTFGRARVHSIQKDGIMCTHWNSNGTPSDSHNGCETWLSNGGFGRESDVFVIPPSEWKFDVDCQPGCVWKANTWYGERDAGKAFQEFFVNPLMALGASRGKHDSTKC